MDTNKIKKKPLQTLRKKCPTCGIDFSCCNTEANGDCWCETFPPLFKPNYKVGCLCPSCLKKATLDKINDYTQNLSPEDAINNKAKDLPKTNHLLQDIDFYLENGNYVSTAWYHLKRGNCCQNNCRHCPYKIKENE